MIQLEIDGKPIAIHGDRTLLEACREHGIHVPTLCYHPSLAPYGACRLCMVEIMQEGRPPRLVSACTYPCEPGLVVDTTSEAVRRNRRVTAELLLAGAHETPEIVALAAELGVREPRFRLPDNDTCVLCGLCVRACLEIVGIGALSLIQRGMEKKVSTPFSDPSATCIGCCTCVLICPTHRLRLDTISRLNSVHRFSSPYDRRYCQVCDEGNTGPEFAPALVSLKLNEQGIA